MSIAHIEISSSVLKIVSRRRLLEAYLWMIIAGIASWPFTRDAFILNKASISEVASVQSGWLLTGIGVLLSPIIFQLIFGVMPFEAIRRWVMEKRGATSLDESANAADLAERLVSSKPDYKWVIEGNDEVLKLLGTLSISSGTIAKGIYSRSGVYLILGVFIAFTGLLFFYSQTSDLRTSEKVTETLIANTPKFGILLFIELIAFFFLRQYRSAMDEYRYYEAIQRHREELLSLIILAKQQGNAIDIESLLTKGMFYSNAKVLEGNQTTEIIESRKLEKNELDLLERMVDLIGSKRKA